MRPEDASLVSALDAVMHERVMRIVTIAEDSSSGTALVQELLDERRDATVVRGGFSSLTPSLGLGPLPELAGALIGAINRPLEEVVDADAPWMLPALHDLLGRSDDPRELAEIYSAFGHLVDERAAASPVVLALYDVHNAGHGFLNLLRFLGDRGTPGLLVVCLGDESFTSSPKWRAVSGPDAVQLAPRPSGEDLTATLTALDERDRTVLAACAAAGTDVTPGMLVEVLEDAADELSNHLDRLAEEGFLVTDRERYSCRERVVRAVRAAYGEPAASTHGAFARVLSAAPAAKTRPELVAAHFERADRMRDAASFLFAAGHASLQRGDMPAAADLLRRCARLLPAGAPLRMKALGASLDALMAIGRVDDALAVSHSARAEAETSSDECSRAFFGLWEQMLGGAPEAEGPVETELESAARVLTSCGHETGAAQAEEALAHALWEAGEPSASVESMQSALRHASDRPTRARIAVWLLTQSQEGPEPITAALRRCEEMSEVGSWSALVEVRRATVTAALEAAQGQDDQSAACLAAARRDQELLGQPGWVARVPQTTAWIALLDGDAGGAAIELRDVFEELAAHGHPVATETGVLLARALVHEGRFPDAIRVVRQSERLVGSGEGVGGGALLSEVEAIGAWVGALQGGTGVDLATVAGRLPPGPYALRRGDALLDLAGAAGTLGDLDSARRFCDEALALYDAKGATACATRARKALAVFRPEV